MEKVNERNEHPLDSIASELVREVRDNSMRSWRAWLRGQIQMGAKIPNMRDQLKSCNFTEEQVRFIWRMVFESSDYVMHQLMDYIDRSLDAGRIRIDIYPKQEPDTEESAEVREPAYTLQSWQQLAGRFSDWSHRYGQMSRDWEIERLREPERRY